MNRNHHRTESTQAPCRAGRRSRLAALLGATAGASFALLLAATGCNGTTSDPDPIDPGETIACGSSELYAVVHDACAPMAATAVGDQNGHCLCMLGYAWDGAACVGLGDCACEGPDCDKLAETIEQCEADHAACLAPAPSIHCGDTALYSVVHDECAPMDATASGDENGHCDCMLGYAWDGTACVGLGDCVCVGADCDKLTMDLEECEAEHASCGAPSGSGISCGDSALYLNLHDECAPMDAVAADDENGAGCYCMLGYAWNGTECVGLGNCRCLGEDCDKLTETLEECQAAHESCG